MTGYHVRVSWDTWQAHVSQAAEDMMEKQSCKFCSRACKIWKSVPPSCLQQLGCAGLQGVQADPDIESLVHTADAAATWEIASWHNQMPCLGSCCNLKPHAYIFHKGTGHWVMVGCALQLPQVLDAIQLSHATFNKIRQNLWWAFGYNLVGIPLAAGALLPSMGIALTPSISGQ